MLICYLSGGIVAVLLNFIIMTLFPIAWQEQYLFQSQWVKINTHQIVSTVSLSFCYAFSTLILIKFFVGTSISKK